MSANRIFQYDFIRVIAMTFVVAVHSLIVIDFSNPFCLFYFHVVQAIFFTCNGMFFMMSGKFALSNAKLDFRYYLAKFETILFPMLVFFVIRTFYINALTPYPDGVTLYQIAYNILGGLANTEYWFLYTLVGNLMLAPLFAKVLPTWSRNDHVLFISLVMSHGALTLFLDAFGIPYSYTLIFFHWSFYFYLGYSVDVLFKGIRHCYIWIAGVGALVVTVLLKYHGIITYVHDLSPIFIILVIAMYFFLYRIASFVPQKIRNFISALARHSFTVYLCHMMVLEIIAQHLPNASGVASIGKQTLLAVLSLSVSVLVAFFLDNSVFRWFHLGINALPHFFHH